MKKFIALTAVSYFEVSVGKTYAEEHWVILDADFIEGITDSMLPGDSFNLEGISKKKFKADGARVILNKKGQAFFNRNIFVLSACNGCMDDNSIYVTEDFNDLKKALC